MARWLWGYSSRQAAANAAYTFADDKPAYLQVEPQRSCTTRIADAAITAVSAARTKLLCFRSYWWSIPLAVASLGLSIAWFIMILIVDADTIRVQYGFEPLPTGAYNKWGLAMYIIVPALWIPMLATTCMEAQRPARWIMYFVSTVFAIMLVIGNALSVTRTHDRRAIEQDFAAQFNTLYCNARIVHACIDNKPAAVLALAGIDNASALNATAKELAVATQCSDAIVTVVSLQLLPISETPRDEKTDAWCTHLTSQKQTQSQTHAGTPLLLEVEHLAPPAPYATHSDLFARYVREWPRRMMYSNALLGSAVGCMLLAAASWKLKQTTECL